LYRTHLVFNSIKPLTVKLYFTKDNVSEAIL